jgi:hypothetical protein
MDTLFDYADNWLRQTGISHQTQFLFGTARKFIQEIEAARPGFSHHLRSAALTHLSDADYHMARKSLIALAIVGHVDDVEAIKEVASRGLPNLAAVARFARFELEHRAV